MEQRIAAAIAANVRTIYAPVERASVTAPEVVPVRHVREVLRCIAGGAGAARPRAVARAGKGL
jgi:hypothetical protein